MIRISPVVDEGKTTMRRINEGIGGRERERERKLKTLTIRNVKKYIYMYIIKNKNKKKQRDKKTKQERKKKKITTTRKKRNSYARASARITGASVGNRATTSASEIPPPPHLPPTDSQLPCGSEEMYDHESPIDYGH